MQPTFNFSKKCKPKHIQIGTFFCCKNHTQYIVLSKSQCEIPVAKPFLLEVGIPSRKYLSSTPQLKDNVNLIIE